MKRLEEIQPLTEEMLEKLARLVQYDSQLAEAKPGMPFGQGPADCLAEGLQIAEEMGFAVKNLDNYCGYAQMGEGEDIIGIAAHLDVVPAGEGWDTDPFTMTRKGNMVYGRGVTDDKGAVIASLYAMDLVRKSGVPLTKRVRLIMGCNEETGSKCMVHYNQVEEPVTAGFTPDGNFPGIFGEKGITGMLVTSKNTNIISMNGGFVTNAVCNRCKTVVPCEAVDQAALEFCLAETPLKGYSVKCENDTLVIEAEGLAAHASTPLLGVNAAGWTMAALQKAGMQDPFVEFYMSHIGTDCDGSGIGLKIQDDYGALTLNNGIVKTQDGVITCTLDIRYPVTFMPEDIRAFTEGKLEDENGKIVFTHIGKPLFHDPDSALVKNLYSAYTEVTGDTVRKPMVIGGGTYAQSLPGIIAFGCEFPEEDCHIHDKNECLSIENLHAQVAIYTQAIINLLRQ